MLIVNAYKPVVVCYVTPCRLCATEVLVIELRRNSFQNVLQTMPEDEATTRVSFDNLD